jgi:tetratricopeptide (TPR) repeat protein
LNNPYAKDEGGSLGRYFENDELQRHNGVSYKFESIFLNDFKNNSTIILLSNNKNIVWDLGHTIHNLMLGKEYEIPKKSVYQAIRKESLDNVNTAIETYYLLKKNSKNEYSFENPGELNKLGYELLRAGKNNESIEIFKLATKEFPKDANLFDSYGEALLQCGKKEEAIKMYQKSVMLNPDNENGKQILLKIEK